MKKVNARATVVCELDRNGFEKPERSVQAMRSHLYLFAKALLRYVA